MEIDISEEQSNVEDENGSEQREMTSRDIVIEKSKRVNSDISEQGRIEFGCSKCDAVNRDRRGLSHHIKLVH